MSRSAAHASVPIEPVAPTTPTRRITRPYRTTLAGVCCRGTRPTRCAALSAPLDDEPRECAQQRAERDEARDDARDEVRRVVVEGDGPRARRHGDATARARAGTTVAVAHLAPVSSRSVADHPGSHASERTSTPGPGVVTRTVAAPVDDVAALATTPARIGLGEPRERAHVRRGEEGERPADADEAPRRRVEARAASPWRAAPVARSRAPRASSASRNPAASREPHADRERQGGEGRGHGRCGATTAATGVVTGTCRSRRAPRSSGRRRCANPHGETKRMASMRSRAPGSGSPRSRGAAGRTRAAGRRGCSRTRARSATPRPSRGAAG